MKFHSLEKAKQSAIHFKSSSCNSAPGKAVVDKKDINNNNNNK